MTPDTLRTCGEALYGSQWISPLAAAVPCSKALLHACLKGDRSITERTSSRVMGLLAERRGEIDKLLASIG